MIQINLKNEQVVKLPEQPNHVPLQHPEPIQIVSQQPQLIPVRQTKDREVQTMEG